ncbi:MAG: helix-turn-helix domain-containing protein, partial [Deltaproteobacteria bacterium]|nr:helix-turn-helix domain-containing protein [Deltaproteobacteria bacterium]
MPGRYVLRRCSEKEIASLRLWASGEAPEPGVALRARIVLMTMDGLSRSQIASGLGISKNSVSLWRRRFDEEGPEGLRVRIPKGQSVPSGYRAARDAVAGLVAAPPPEGFRSWSVRLLSEKLRMGAARIREVLSGEGISLAPSRRTVPPASPRSPRDMEILRRWAGGLAPSERAAGRAASVLAVLDGSSRADEARRSGMSLTMLFQWLRRFAEDGPEGLLDRPGRGRRPGRRLGGRALKELRGLLGTPPPEGTAWTPEAAAGVLGISPADAARTVLAEGLLPGFPSGASAAGEDKGGTGEELPQGSGDAAAGRIREGCRVQGVGGLVGGDLAALSGRDARDGIRAPGEPAVAPGSGDMDSLRRWAGGEAPDEECRGRAAAVLAVLEGAKIPAAADAHGVQAWKLRYWKSRFESYGTRGLLGRRRREGMPDRPGSSGLADAVLRDRALELAASPPPEGAGFWDRKSLALGLGVSLPRLCRAVRGTGLTPGPTGPGRRIAADAARASLKLPPVFLEILERWAGEWDGERPPAGQGGAAPGVPPERILFWRAAMVRRCLTGHSATVAAGMCGTTATTAVRWKRRFLSRGPAALLELPGSGPGRGFGEGELSGRLLREAALALSAAPPPPRPGFWDIATAALVLGMEPGQARALFVRSGISVKEPPAEDAGGDSAVSEPSSRVDSVVSEPSSRVDSAASDPSSRVDSAASEPSSKEDSAASEPSSKGDSAASERSSKEDSAASDPS